MDWELIVTHSFDSIDASLVILLTKTTKTVGLARFHQHSFLCCPIEISLIVNPKIEKLSGLFT